MTRGAYTSMRRTGAGRESVTRTYRRVGPLVLVDTVIQLDDVDIADVATLPQCGACGAVTAPDGTCLEIGACSRADRSATRGAARETAKYRPAPAAWSSRGSVD